MGGWELAEYLDLINSSSDYISSEIVSNALSLPATLTLIFIQPKTGSFFAVSIDSLQSDYK